MPDQRRFRGNPVGNLWEKPGVGPGKEGVPPEEGSEPGALRGYAAVCHGHGHWGGLQR